MDFGLRFEAARPGDSISRLVGSSDPRAIGKFLSLNGMDGRDSTLRSGRSYVVPTRCDDATAREAKAGEALLGADNSRLMASAEQRTDRARQGELLLQGRNIWTAESVRRRPDEVAVPRAWPTIASRAACCATTWPSAGLLDAGPPAAGADRRMTTARGVRVVLDDGVAPGATFVEWV